VQRIFAQLAFLFLLSFSTGSQADYGDEILSKSRDALRNLVSHQAELEPLLQQAKGVLVFPDLVEMGFAVSGQYGEGVLLIKDEPAAYYASAGSSFGLGSDVDYKSEVILFFTEQALLQFRSSRGWQVGLDSPVSRYRSEASGVEGGPVMGIIFSDLGLQDHLSLDGNRVVRIAR
jgi:lipid-binding SYLF domain-containing protein